jgi:hypothetical protein
LLNVEKGDIYTPELGYFFMCLTEFEREVLASDEKRKSISKNTVRKTLWKARNKGEVAIRDLVFLAVKRPDQFCQVVGLTRTGRSALQVLSSRKKRERRGGIVEKVDSKRDIDRIEKGDRALMLYTLLGLWTGAVDEKVCETKLKGSTQARREGFDVDLTLLNRKYPVAMLEGQFLCPRCRKKGLIFHDGENWLFMHYSRDGGAPSASFCDLGRELPEDFMAFPLKITPQYEAFFLAASDKPINPHSYRFRT